MHWLPQRLAATAAATAGCNDHAIDLEHCAVGLVEHLVQALDLLRGLSLLAHLELPRKKKVYAVMTAHDGN